MESIRPVSGLYVITDERDGQFYDLVERVLAAGIELLQYRDKTSIPVVRWKIALRLREMTRDFGTLLIVNDSVTLAADSGADGVHLGIESAALPFARKLLGDAAVIGVSVHSSIADARRMQEMGATYAAFGSVYRSPTKPRAPRVSLETLRAAHQELRIPVVAIGGITPRNAGAVLEAGASAIAVISGVWRARFPDRAVHAYREVLQKFAKSAPLAPQ